MAGYHKNKLSLASDMARRALKWILEALDGGFILAREFIDVASGVVGAAFESQLEHCKPPFLNVWYAVSFFLPFSYSNGKKLPDSCL